MIFFIRKAFAQIDPPWCRPPFIRTYALTCLSWISGCHDIHQPVMSLLRRNQRDCHALCWKISDSWLVCIIRWPFVEFSIVSILYLSLTLRLKTNNWLRWSIRLSANTILHPDQLQNQLKLRALKTVEWSPENARPQRQAATGYPPASCLFSPTSQITVS